MHKLLIVDDEEILVKGLVEMLQNTEEMDLEVHGACSADQAIKWLERTSMDIVLTDIQMPGMNGLQLQKEITRRWPRCKVIFLTGYDDFSYAQEAIRNGGSDYLLKTEGDQAVMNVLHRTIGKLKYESSLIKMVEKAKDQLRWAIPYRQKEFLLELVNGSRLTSKQLSCQVEELELPFDTDGQVLMAVGRIDDWKGTISSSDQALFLFAIQNIAAELLATNSSIAATTKGNSEIIWFLQPLEGCDESHYTDLRRFVHGTMEYVQKKSCELLKMSLSIVVARDCIEWSQTELKYESLKHLLNRQLGLGYELYMIESVSTGKVGYQGMDPAKQKSRSVRKTLEMLQLCLDFGQKESFMQQLVALLMDMEETSEKDSFEWMETYFALAYFFSSNILQNQLYERIGKELDLNVLTRVDGRVSAKERTEYYITLARLIFQHKSEGWHEEGMNLIHKLRRYIEDNLHGDLSLTRLGEVTAHNPSYLSRLYKQITGEGLSETIFQAKLTRARKLLGDPKNKVHEVSAAVGIDSARYFAKFFKKATGFTPQEYRDSLRKIETSK